MGATSNNYSLFRNFLGNRMIPVLLVIALIVLSFLGWVYWHRFQKIFALRAEITELQDEKRKLRQEISELIEERNKRNDLDYIEKLAKEELGLVYPKSEKSEENS